MFDLRALDGTPLAIARTEQEARERYSFPGALHVVVEDMGARNFFGTGKYTWTGSRHMGPVEQYNRDAAAAQVEHLAARYRRGELPAL
ncbi:hypothetical protein SUDANB95_05502 [Actinosynnema sp. ALI-1.44]